MSWELIVGAFAGIGWSTVAWPWVRRTWNDWRNRREQRQLEQEEAERCRLPEATALTAGGRRYPVIERPSKAGHIGQTPRTRSPLGDPFSAPTGDVGRKAPAKAPRPPKIPPGTLIDYYTCHVCGAASDERCDAGLHS